jgi:hypothetical protein
MAEFFYKLGYYSVYVANALAYGIGTAGVVYYIYNRQLPFIPLIFLMVYSVWKKTFIIYHNSRVNSINNTITATIDTNDLEDVINAINYKNMYLGGPN